MSVPPAQEARVKYVLRYTAVQDFLPLAQEHFPAHSARADEFAARGVLLMIGVLDEPMNGDAMAVFTSREAAEEFVADDPFVVNGVVAEWSVRPWHEALVPESRRPEASAGPHPQG